MRSAALTSPGPAIVSGTDGDPEKPRRSALRGVPDECPAPPAPGRAGDRDAAETRQAAKRADTVNETIAAVRHVAAPLFREWEAEIGQYNDPDLARMSRRDLTETRRRYEQLASVMEKPAAKMDPVLARLHDQVLFLKHNLNAQAIASLEKTNVTLQGDVDKLIADMQKSIEESNKFISSMKTP